MTKIFRIVIRTRGITGLVFHKPLAIPEKWHKKWSRNCSLS